MSLQFDPSGQRSVAVPPSSLGDETQEAHPLETHLKRAAVDEREAKLYEARVMYGPALAMRLASEDLMASEVGRLPGLPSSNIMRDTVRGDSTTIGFEDVLNLPHERPEAPKASIHEMAERKFLIPGAPSLVPDEGGFA